ncbi:TPA: hypothetical protein H2R31_004504 [Salmonella enterica]|nr:hypothetical protein [Salmonella enterica subsp. enterica serovar Newport]EMA3634550.1 hypothetical protein [Salmonella enterica]HAK6119395.1 hypothetical protein [Salmonella enterica]
MSDDTFMTEVRHRATLLTESLNPGKALEWTREEGHSRLLFRMLEESGAFRTGGPHDSDEIIAFWKNCLAYPEAAGFIACLGSGAHVLCRRGLKGDPCSVPVFHLVIRDFVARYIRPGRKILSGSAIKH